MNESATQPLNEQQKQAMSIAETMMQGAARIFEMQATAARTVFENQSRTASMFGAPDLFSTLKPAGSMTEFFDTSTQQAAAFMRQSNETFTQVQRQLSQLIEAQTKWMTEQMRKSMDEFTRQTGESLKQWRDISRQTADEAERTEQSGQQAMQSSASSPSIVVSGGLEGTRAAQPQSRPEERAKASAKR